MFSVNKTQAFLWYSHTKVIFKNISDILGLYHDCSLSALKSFSFFLFLALYSFTSSDSEKGN